MVANTPSLPELSEHEARLLHTYIILRYDMVALAEQQNLLPQQLLAFAHSAAVRAQLASLRAFAEESFALRALESRTTAITQLEEIARTTENPIEKRRAASTVLRGLGAHNTKARNGRQPDPHSNNPAASRRSKPAEPTASPTPTTSRGDIAYLTTKALETQSPSALATLHAFLAPDATINGEPAPESREDFVAAAPERLSLDTPAASSKYTFLPEGPEPHPLLITLSHDSAPDSRFILHYIRAASAPHAGCWLIKSLTRMSTDSS
jgi:hypothetical protein